MKYIGLLLMIIGALYIGLIAYKASPKYKNIKSITIVEYNNKEYILYRANLHNGCIYGYNEYNEDITICGSYTYKTIFKDK